MPLLASAKAVVIVVQVVLQLVVDVAMHVGMIVVAALVHAKETVMVAAVNVAEIVPAHAQIHVPVPAQGHVLMTVKVLALVIVRGAAIQDVQIVMGVVVVEAAMEVVA